MTRENGKNWTVACENSEKINVDTAVQYSVSNFNRCLFLRSGEVVGSRNELMINSECLL